MKMIKWFAVNALVLAFVLFGTMLPVSVFSGIYFVACAILAMFAVLYFFALVAVWIAPIQSAENMAQLELLNRPRWFWFLDVGFDLVLIGTMAGVGFWAMPIFYTLACAVFWAFKLSLTSMVEAYNEDTDSVQFMAEQDLDDLPEYMRDEP